jgi:Cu-Zn family superoxide dismutase
MMAGMLAGAVATAVLTAVGAGTAADAAGVNEAGAKPSRPAAVAGEAREDGANYFQLRTAARFAPQTALVPSLALTYNVSLVPAGAGIEVEQRSSARETTVRVRVRGVRPGHVFGVHVHQKPCAADPAAAGGHYQHQVDPVQPSTNPDYVNPENEVWLDFTADARGAGSAQARHDWGFRSGQAGSVVIHDAPGTKGARVACFTVPFGAVSIG